MVSVCLASYNGAKHIARQLKSILDQLAADDEVIVSDDGSTDGTLDVIRGMGDARVRVVEGPHEGVSKNFENAIKLAKGDIIFLSDQDDEWLPNKVQEVLAAFKQTKCYVVMHDGVVVRENGEVIYPSLFKKRGVRHGLLANIIKSTCCGSAMAFRREFVPKFMPIRASNLGNMHDTWIGYVAEFYGGSYFLDKILYKYYRYQSSVTPEELKPYPLHRQILKRLITVKNILLFVLARAFARGGNK